MKMTVMKTVMMLVLTETIMAGRRIKKMMVIIMKVMGTAVKQNTAVTRKVRMETTVMTNRMM